MTLKTRAEVRQEFARHGWTITSWAKAKGYSQELARDIFNDDDVKPKRKCLRGESHNIAVSLGIKEGVVSRPVNVQSFAMTAAA